MQSLGLRGHAPTALCARRAPLPLHRPGRRGARAQPLARRVVAQAAENGNGAKQFQPVCVNERGIVASADFGGRTPCSPLHVHRRSHA